MNLDSPITEIKGVGEKTAGLFAKLSITDVRSLLGHFPRSYEDMRMPVTASEARGGMLCAVSGRILKTPVVKRYSSVTVTIVWAGDSTGLFRVIFYGMQYLRQALKPGMAYIFRGVVKQTQKQPGARPDAAGGNSTGSDAADGRKRSLRGEADCLFTMEHPKLYRPEEYCALQGSLQPCYPLTQGLTNATVTRTVRNALAAIPEEAFRDFLPETDRTSLSLLSWSQAVTQIHFPPDTRGAQEARRRFAFEEFLLFFLSMEGKKERQERRLSHVLRETEETACLIARLPYTLTDAQKRCWEEIRSDLTKPFAMHRLVQGDVGSGKTILAILALLLCSSNGCQGALMVPTEVLARQHYDTLCRMSDAYGLSMRPVLLTGSVRGKERREKLLDIASGRANVIVGTHALIQEKVCYHGLSLVVTDEQHRFGVRQREALAGKGQDVHVLVMSATPIPRTLAIVLYGQLQVSVLDEVPAGHLPVKNCVVDTSYRNTAYRFIRGQIEAGHQAFCICPTVEPGEMEGLENVTEYTEKLRSVMPDSIRISSLHGRMKNAEKTKIMEAFAAGEIDLLVSTTVVEVGIDVPNATVMLIENAERFGLSQLHQLRGRVGRGKEQGYCIFISASREEAAWERLEILRRTNDGFEIAAQDLKLRGPGELNGIRQSGEMGFRVADIYQDADLLYLARDYALRVNEEDPDRNKEKYSLLREWEARQEDLVDFAGI